MKKFISLLILVLLTISVVSGCGPTNTENAEEVIEEEAVYKDMGGEEFIFLSGWETELFPAEGFSIAGDAANARIKQVNENFNFIFTVKNGGLPDLTNAIAAVTDIPMTSDLMSETFSAYKSGYFTPYEQVTTMDINDAELWGSKNFLQYGLFDGANHYGIMANQWQSTPQFAGCLLVNNELLRNLGVTKTPYEMIENKEWNWDNFKALLETCTSTEGDKSTYGMGYNGGGESDAILGKVACFSNNVEVLNSNEVDGKLVYEFGMNSPEAFAALDYVASLIKAGYVKRAADNYGGTDFSTSLTPFLLCESWVGTEYSNKDDSAYPADKLNDYGFLYFPHGPNADSGTVSSYVHRFRRLIYLVGVSEHDIDDSGMILNAMFQPLSEDNSLSWKYFTKKNVFHHDEDYENFIVMIDNMRYDYSTFLGDTNDTLGTAIISTYTGSKTPVEAISGLEEKISTAIEKAFSE